MTKLYIFTEYMSLGSVANIIKSYGKLNEEVVKKITRQMLLGLE